MLGMSHMNYNTVGLSLHSSVSRLQNYALQCLRISLKIIDVQGSKYGFYTKIIILVVELLGVYLYTHLLCLVPNGIIFAQDICTFRDTSYVAIFINVAPEFCVRVVFHHVWCTWGVKAAMH